MNQQSINFTSLLVNLSRDNLYKNALEHSKTKYNIKLYNIQALTPQKIKLMYKSIQKKFYDNRLNSIDQGWYENQLKVFIWTLVGYSFIHNKSIRQFNQENWTFFSEIFNYRPTIFLQFQGRFLCKSKKKTNHWTNQQVQLLRKIIRKKELANKWNCVAKELFVQSKKAYFKTPKQCRQKWLNHLDPLKKRSTWDLDEDQILLKSVFQQGKKWSYISKILSGTRTQHMVKNRYKSLILNAQKTNMQGTQNQILLHLIQKIKNTKQKDRQNQAQEFISIQQIQASEVSATDKKNNQKEISTFIKIQAVQQNPQFDIQEPTNENNQIQEQKRQNTLQKFNQEQEQFIHLKEQINTYATKFDINRGQMGDVNQCPFFQQCEEQSFLPFVNENSLFSSLISKDQEDRNFQYFFNF